MHYALKVSYTFGDTCLLPATDDTLKGTCRDVQKLVIVTDGISVTLPYLPETSPPCPQAFLSSDFQCGDDISETK